MVTTLDRTSAIIRGCLILTAIVAVSVWLLIHSLRNSDDPARLIAKWVLTLIVVGILIATVAPGVSGLLFVVVGALCLGILWGSSLGEMVARPFSDLFDGGSAPIDPQPFYSIAQARRKQGKYLEALAEIRRQLEKFPQDIVGQMMLAEIQAVELQDLSGAEVTLQRLCRQPGHAARNVADALNQLADWHLKYAQDAEAARLALEQIIQMLPDSEQAQFAAQRIARLATPEGLTAAQYRGPIHLRPGVDNIGLLKDSSALQNQEEDPAKKAGDYVRHLEQHPLDFQAREKLALIYAEHYGRLDFALDQLEQIVQQPNQPAREVVRSLNLGAELQIKYGRDYEGARLTIQRIIDLYPESAPAQLARQRLGQLRLEMKGQEKSQAIPLGSYEQNIGLKSSKGYGGRKPPE